MATAREKTIYVKEDDLLKLLEKNRALDAINKLYEIVLQSLDFDEMAQRIADIIPQTLGYETGVLSLINEEENMLKRVAISKTPGGEAALKHLEIPFTKIDIPLDYKKNACIQAIDKREQIITKNLHDLLCPAVSEKNAALVQKTMGTNISVVNPLFVHNKPIGVFIVSMSKSIGQLSAFEQEMIRGFSESVGVAIENAKLYTDLKNAKDILNKTYEELKDLDKLKDDLISMASHELRTPMTIIRSYLWMLQTGKHGGMNKKQKEYVDTAMRGTQRLIDLVNNMLNVARIEQNRSIFKIKRIKYCDVLKETIKGFEMKAAEKNLTLMVQDKCKSEYIYADEDKLREIMTNLLGNAIKFTQRGGIAITFEDEEEHVKVSVIDSGKGIEKESQKSLFNKFGRLDNTYTTVAEAGGSGLGLYIVKLYIEKMGGTVGVESEGLEKGSTFWITLPKKKPKVEATLSQNTTKQ